MRSRRQRHAEGGTLSSLDSVNKNMMLFLTDLQMTDKAPSRSTSLFSLILRSHSRWWRRQLINPPLLTQSLLVRVNDLTAPHPKNLLIPFLATSSKDGEPSSKSPTTPYTHLSRKPPPQDLPECAVLALHTNPTLVPEPCLAITKLSFFPSFFPLLKRKTEKQKKKKHQPTPPAKNQTSVHARSRSRSRSRSSS